MWNENELTQMLRIKYPIIQAGMAGGATTPELVAAVSNAGGLGMIGAGYMKAVDLEQDIKQIKRLTPNAFGVNLFIPEFPGVEDKEIKAAEMLLKPFKKELNLTDIPFVEPKQSSQFEQQIDVIVKQKVPICSFTFGIPPQQVIKRLQKENIIVIGTATTVQEAILNEEAGMDMIVAQGSEAGGHRGTFSVPFEQGMIGTMALIPQVVDQVTIPVIGAGGIADGRGLLAAKVLGAQAVQIGTGFLTTLESGAHARHKEAILTSSEDKSVITSAFSGKPARGIMNKFIEEMARYERMLPKYPIQNTLTNRIRKEAGKQNKPALMSLWAGQNMRQNKVQATNTYIAKLVEEVETHLSDLGAGKRNIK